MTNEEYESAVARADDFLDMLKDTCHDQHDKIKELEKRIDFLIDMNDKKQVIIDNAIEYIKKEYNEYNREFDSYQIWLEDLLNILKGDKYGD